MSRFSDKKLRKLQMRDALIYWALIPGAVIGSGKAADLLFHYQPFSVNTLILTSAVLFISFGSLLIFKSMKDLSVYGNGSPNPLRPPLKLVRHGSYRICRHPMFLGYDIAALGVILLFGSPGMLFISCPLFMAYELYFLHKEERILALRFHNAFKDYRRQVSFLIPINFRRRNT